MKIQHTDSGREILVHRATKGECRGLDFALVQQARDLFSGEITSKLWIDRNFELDRAQVAELIQHLQAWLSTGSLELAEPAIGSPGAMEADKPAIVPTR